MRWGVIVAMLAAGALVLASAAPFASAGEKTIPVAWSNCTHVHARYNHGVGRAGAHDQVKGTSEPVTNFYRSTATYNRAIHFNQRLDADKDRVACEKH